MYGELSWDYFDELVDAYAPASAYADQLPKLEAKIARVCDGMVRTKKSTGDFFFGATFDVVRSAHMCRGNGVEGKASNRTEGR